MRDEGVPFAAHIFDGEMCPFNPQVGEFSELGMGGGSDVKEVSEETSDSHVS